MVQNVNEMEFEAQVLKSKKPVLVDFWAEWCGPCRSLGPTLEAISKEREDISIVKVNVDENPDLAAKYRITSIPLMIIFNNGELVDTQVGAIPKARIEEWINKSIQSK